MKIEPLTKAKEDFSVLADKGERLSLKPGALLFEEGETAKDAYVLIEGTVDIIKETPSGPLTVSDIAPGALFGEIGLFDGAPRSASARARGHVTVAKIPAETLSDLMDETPQLRQRVLRHISGYIRTTNALLADNGDRAPLKEKGLFRKRDSFSEFQPDAIEIEQAPLPSAAILAPLAILLLIAGLSIWAAVSEIDVTVSTNGRIVPSVSNIPIRATQTTELTDLNVRAGDRVRKGDVLAILDGTSSLAELNAAQGQERSIMAQIKRLRTEQRVVETGEFDPTGIEGFSDDPASDSLQRAIFSSRLREYLSEIKRFTEADLRLAEETEGLKTEAGILQQQLAALRDLEADRKSLLDKGLLPRPQFLSVKNQRLGVDRELMRVRNRIRSNTIQMRENEAEKASFVSNWQAKIAQELNEVSVELSTLREKIHVQQRQRQQIRLKAPVSGTVLEIVDGRSAGTVVQQGEEVLTIVPSNVPLRASIAINPKDIGLVKVDDPVTIRLEALPFTKHGTMPGRILSISEDAYIADERQEEEPAYHATVELGEADFRNPPKNFRLVPGMRLTGDVNVGKRTVLSYFLRPLLRWLDTSIREP